MNNIVTPILHHTDDGLRIVVCESHGAPVVAIQAWIDVGSADESEAEGGLAHVHEHMLFKGTARRGVGEIAGQVEAAGGDINAWTSYDHTVYHVVMASEFFDTGLDILADALCHSAFDKEELDRELEVILEEIKRSDDNPGSRVARALFELSFDVHPYRRPVIGHKEVVEKFSRDDVLAFYHGHYCKERTCVVVAGDVDTQEVIQKVTDAFASLRTGARPREDRPAEPEPQGLRGRVLFDEVELCHLGLGFKGPPLTHPDSAALDVLCVLLGQIDSSRLSRKLRHEQRLVQSVYAYPYSPREDGLVVIGAQLSPDNLAPTLDIIAQELHRLSTDLCDEAEIEKARTILASECTFQQETVQGLAIRIGYWATLADDPAFEGRYLDAVAAVTAEQVRDVVRTYLGGDRLRGVVLLPEAHQGQDTDESFTHRLRTAFVDGAPDVPHPAPAPPPSWPKAVSPSRPPAELRRAPRREHMRLDSGATLIVEEDPTHPIVSVRAAWLGGTRGEREESLGHAHLVGSLLCRGTEQRSAEALSAQVDSMAGELEGFSGRNSIGVRGTFLKDAFEEGFELFAECVRGPGFAEDEVERIKKVTLDDIRSKRDDAAGLCFELFMKTLWTSHPYRRSVLGRAATVSAATRDNVRDHFRSRCAPQNAVFTVVGDVKADQARGMFERLLYPTAWTPDRVERWSPAAEPAPARPEVSRLCRDKAQAHLVVGHRGLALEDDARPALEVLVACLSGQAGRLFLELRDKKSLCYSVSAFSIEGVEPGSFGVYMGTSPHKVDEGLTGIDAILADVCAHGITDAELARARRYLIGTHGIGLQRLGARASAMVFAELYGLGFDEHLRYAHRIQNTSKHDVRDLAQRLLDPAHRIVTIVGPDDTGGPAATFHPQGLSIDEPLV